MSQIIYTGPLAGVVTPDGTQFLKGVPVDVSAELSAALLLQTFVDASANDAPAPAPVAQPAASFTAPAAVPAPAPVAAPDPTPAPDSAVTPDPAPVVPDPTPAPAPVQGATVLAPVSGVTA